MSCIGIKQKYLFVILGSFFLFGIFINKHVYANGGDKISYYQRRLQQDGYNTETTEGIIAATKSRSAYTREIALKVLTSHNSQEAIPILKGALDDNDVIVRYTSAHLLGTLRDKSGLERMQKDFEEFIPKEEEPNDTNILRDKREMEQWTRKHRYRIVTALEIGKVLAELGDFRAYALAAKEGLTSEHELGYIRLRAAETLGEIGKKDVNELKMQGKDPIGVLCAMAEIEKESAVFRRVRIVADEIGGKTEARILEKAAMNPHQSESERNITQSILADVKKRVDSNTPSSLEPNYSR